MIKKQNLSRIWRENKEAKLKTKLLLLMNGDYIIDQVPLPWQISSSPISFHSSHTADLAPCRLVWISIPIGLNFNSINEANWCFTWPFVISSSLSTLLASSLLRIMYFPVRVAKICLWVNSSTTISFMRCVPSLMSIIQPLMERSIVITVLLCLLLYKLYLVLQKLRAVCLFCEF